MYGAATSIFEKIVKLNVVIFSVNTYNKNNRVETTIARLIA